MALAAPGEVLSFTCKCSLECCNNADALENKKYLQRGWWVLDAGDGVSRAACTAPGFGFHGWQEGTMTAQKGLCAHVVCVPTPRVLRNSIPWCTKMEANLSEN